MEPWMLRDRIPLRDGPAARPKMVRLATALAGSLSEVPFRAVTHRQQS